MQSTGQASTQAASLVPIQGSAITYAIFVHSANLQRRRACAPLRYFSTLIVAHGPAAPRQVLGFWFCHAGTGRKGNWEQGTGKGKTEVSVHSALIMESKMQVNTRSAGAVFSYSLLPPPCLFARARANSSGVEIGRASC